MRNVMLGVSISSPLRDKIRIQAINHGVTLQSLIKAFCYKISDAPQEILPVISLAKEIEQERKESSGSR